MDTTAKSKICPCGEPIVKKNYETIKQFEKRERSGFCRSKCRSKYHKFPEARSRFGLEVPEDKSVVRVGPGFQNYLNTGPRPFKGDLFKDNTPRDPAYLDWVRTFDCCECGWPAHMGHIEAHHVETGGMAIKASDYLAVPLCSPEARGCHAKADKTPLSVTKYKPYALYLNTLWVKSWNTIKKGG